MSIKNKIFRFLLQNKEGTRLTDIVKGIGESRQSIMYNLNCMVSNGSAVKIEGLYFLQPFLYANDLEDNFIQFTKEVIEMVEITLCDDSVVSEKEATINSVKLLLGVIGEKMQNVFT